jgi:serine/threonine protein kinase
MSEDSQFRRNVCNWCYESDREIISVAGQSPEVIRKNSFAIKHGGVQLQEAENQRKARILVDPARVKVPQVFDFFENEEGTESYLVMEYIEGRSDINYCDPHVISAIADALDHLHSISGDTLGPVVESQWTGILWDDAQPPQGIKSKPDLARFLNKRLLEPSDKIDIGEYDLGLTHLDTVPRNIKITKDGIVCMLDWSSAGYFPPFFEISALHLNTGNENNDSKYCSLLIDALVGRQNLDDAQLRDVKRMVKFVHNNIRHSL